MVWQTPSTAPSHPCPAGSMARLSLRWPFLLAMLSALLATSVATDTMKPGDTVSDGKSLISTGGGFRLGFFSPGRSRFRYLGIWYNTISQQTVIWVANRDRGIENSTGVLSFTGNGSLVLSDIRGEVYWSTAAAAAGVASPVARLLDNANFVVITDSGGGIPAWQSFDYPTDSLLPGMKLGWDLRAGRNRNLTPWRSADDPAPGEFTVGMDARDDPQISVVRRTGGARLWRSGPWFGTSFSRIPEVSRDGMFRVRFFRTADEIYCSFEPVNNNIPSRLMVKPSKLVAQVVELVVWIEGAKSWNRLWFAPKDQCDTVGPCGPFGVCDINSSPVCSCLHGFEPRSPPPPPHDWYLPSDGCARRTALDCRNGTDGFEQVAVARIPAAVVDYTMELDECRAACLRNCSCTAYAKADLRGVAEVVGRGCALWIGNLTDLRGSAIEASNMYVRVAAADLVQSTSRPKWVLAVVAVSAVPGAAVLGWIYWLLRRRRRRKTTTIVRGSQKNSHVTVGSRTKTMNQTGAQALYQIKTRTGGADDLDLPLTDFKSIAAATDGFSADNKLGEGGFGPVYVGRMEDGQEVAVKRLAKNSVQGVDEFKNEVMLIANLQHRNLVRLLGCCIEGEERMLVYEYMPNKSLDAFLFDRTKGSLLDWNTRYKIIKGIARGLLYLHQDSRLRIIHRDLKASNVLLDKEMNPKISDFGMARMFSGDQTEDNTRRVVGTYGYMSPEYITRGLFSVKSDVFSFGVVVLEIVSGKRNRASYLSDPNLNLLGYAWSLWKAGKWMEIADSSMADGFPTAELLKCIKVGLLCVQERPEDRPTMASVVEMWGDNMESLPQPMKPAFMATRGPFEMWSLSKGKLCSVNEVTITDACNGR